MDEIFKTYAKFYVTHADMPLLNFEDFSKATIAWEEKKKEILQTEIDKFLNTPRERNRSKFNFDFINELSSLIFWHGMNWRDFHFIELFVETNNYSKYLELRIILLGIGFEFCWYRI